MSSVQGCPFAFCHGVVYFLGWNLLFTPNKENQIQVENSFGAHHPNECVRYLVGCCPIPLVPPGSVQFVCPNHVQRGPTHWSVRGGTAVCHRLCPAAQDCVWRDSLPQSKVMIGMGRSSCAQLCPHVIRRVEFGCERLNPSV